MGDVRTLFIGGLPTDTTERELHLLFYEGGGCEAIRLQYPQPGRATAFVQFPTRERALSVASWVNGMIFDPADLTSTLRAEIAKTDFKGMPGWAPGGGAPVGGGGGMGMSMPMGMPMGMAVAESSPKRPRTDMHEGRLTEKNQCTLFIGSLGETVSQQELLSYVSSQDGFAQLTMKDEGTPRAVAWAQYATPEFAMHALANLVTLPLPSVGRPPNIEAARSNTGEGGSRAMGGSAPWPQQRSVGGGGGGGGGSSTVFLGNLEPQVTEQELQSMLIQLQGFIKLTARGLAQGRGTAWAQFDSPNSAANACMTMQNAPVPSMGRPANAEIARSDMRS